MRPMLAVLCGMLSVFLSAQPARLDHGRLDPAWFGPGVIFEQSPRVYFMWVRPGLSLRGRSLRMGPWEPAAWLVKPRPEKDQAFLRRLEPILIPSLLEGLRVELREALPASMETGDVVLIGRVTDCRADGVGGMFGGVAGIYFDLKLVDARSGELLVGVHHLIEGETAESIQARYQKWCRTFARVLAELTLPPIAPPVLLPLAPAASSQASPQPAPPAKAPIATAELEATLRRLETLKRDGLLTEAEFEILRKQAVEGAKSPR